MNKKTGSATLLFDEVAEPIFLKVKVKTRGSNNACFAGGHTRTHRSQPMYVIQECDPKLSMYSQWKTRPCDADSSPLGVGPAAAMALYDSRHRPLEASVAQSREGGRMVLTHSSYWTNRDRPTSSANHRPPLSAASPQPSPLAVANHNRVRSNCRFLSSLMIINESIHYCINCILKNELITEFIKFKR